MATNGAPNSNVDSNTKPSVYLQDMEEVKKIFSRFDTNGDGKISVKELDSVLQALGSSLPSADLQIVMADLDSDNDGFINLEEFAAFYRSTSPSDDAGASELRDAFDLYDQDCNGLISHSELHLVLNRLGMTRSIEDCKRMIQSVDSDGDGNVNFEEFKTMMTNSTNTSNASAQ